MRRREIERTEERVSAGVVRVNSSVAAVAGSLGECDRRGAHESDRQPKGREASPFDRSIDVQVSRLRRKLQCAPDVPEIIKTVRFGGYVFAAEVMSC